MAFLSLMSGIANGALSIAKAIGAIGLAVEGVKVVVGSLVDVCKSFKLLKEEIKPEELGDKAIQAEEKGIRKENFETYKEYVQAIENFEINAEKSLLTNELEKNEKASELSAGLLLEKMPGVNLAGIPIIAEKFSPEKTAAIISELSNGNGTCDKYNNIIDVVTNKEKDTAKISEGLNGLVNIEKKLDPELSDKEALKRAMNSLQEMKD